MWFGLQYPNLMNTHEENMPNKMTKKSGRRTCNALYKTEGNSVELGIKLKGKYV